MRRVLFTGAGLDRIAFFVSDYLIEGTRSLDQGLGEIIIAAVALIHVQSLGICTCI